MIITKADKYMVEMIHHIKDHGCKDVNPRPHYADGTPAHTLFVNHTFRQYDLSKGEFPICTLRPMAWKTGIREIFTIYQKPTNNIAKMHEMGVNWWDEWDIGDGTIGQRYGATIDRYDLPKCRHALACGKSTVRQECKSAKAKLIKHSITEMSAILPRRKTIKSVKKSTQISAIAPISHGIRLLGENQATKAPSKNKQQNKQSGLR